MTQEDKFRLPRNEQALHETMETTTIAELPKNDISEAWDKLLNPKSFKKNLLIGGIYLLAYEMFKDSLITFPEYLFCHEYKNGKLVQSLKYKTEVLSLDEKHIYHASALWWKKQGVITNEEVSSIDDIREHRYEVAHNTPEYLGSLKSDKSLELLESMFSLLSKIDKWQLIEVEMPAYDEFDGKEFTKDELDKVMSGKMVFLSLMIPIAFGDDSRLRETYEYCKTKMSLINAKKV